MLYVVKLTVKNYCFVKFKYIGARLYENRTTYN